MNEGKTDIRLLLMMYALAFILLMEWLLPVVDLTDTDHLGVFLYFIALSFIFGLLKFRWWVSISLKIIYLFLALHYVFFENVFLTQETTSLLITDLVSNFSFIAAGDWENISNPFRTVLFFILLWMTIYLIRHWIEVRKSIVLFYAMTVVFIAVLDTFSSYNADGAIFRIMMTGLLLIGLLTISKLAEKHGRKMSAGMFAGLSLPLLFAVIASGTLASFLPEKEPVWADPVPFLKSLVNADGLKVNGGAVSSSGYDPDDSRLGGSFVQDSTVIFKAAVSNKQYWRIETKNTYTSKGWEQNVVYGDPLSIQPGDRFADDMTIMSDDEEMHSATINMKTPLPFLVYPYGTSSIHTALDVELNYQPENGRFWALEDGEKIELDSYSVDFSEYELYSLKALRESKPEKYGPEVARYLQLPENLPDRVKELALNITETEESVYEKVKKVERYFGRSGFVYDQQNVAIPQGEEDYVDQFLFDTKRGYCDNFSTSMVVLLRAADIPARWAKGFAPGDGKKNSRGLTEYTITNNEAHSWVEAYIPDFGWMPFEPTIGFSNPTRIDYDIELDISDPEIPEMEEQIRQEQEKVETPAKVQNNADPNSLILSIKEFTGKNKWLLLLGLAVTALIAWKLYSHRGKWLPRLVVQTNRSKKSDWEQFSKQYKSLLKQLNRVGLKRSESVTLSEYAELVDSHYGGSNMGRLTEVYEQGLYGGYTTDQDWPGLKEMWESLINRASG